MGIGHSHCNNCFHEVPAMGYRIPNKLIDHEKMETKYSLPDFLDFLYGNITLWNWLNVDENGKRKYTRKGEIKAQICPMPLEMNSIRLIES